MKMACLPTFCQSCFSDEVRKMRNNKNQRKSYFPLAQLRRCCWKAAFAGSLLITTTAAASSAPASQALVNKFALDAYCSEAQSKSTSLADGNLSYKGVAELASNRALLEHPSIYRDSAGWKFRIVAILDQYGDEPTSQLCNEKPGPQS